MSPLEENEANAPVEAATIMKTTEEANDEKEAFQKQLKADNDDTAAPPSAAPVAADPSVSITTYVNEERVPLDEMKDQVWFLFPDINRRVKTFFLLITLSAIIATSGVAGDSAATVIGAMIVAPLMTPILGTMLGIVLGDAKNCLFSFVMVLTGAMSAFLVGYIFGLFLYDSTIYAENNSQIASRVNPKLTDLIGAIATGAVASIALVRADIAPTLPGVAIAISLVPPLNVVGLTLSTGRGNDALGALLLFATNFTSILFVGAIVMYIYRVPQMVPRSQRQINFWSGFVGILTLLVIVTVPLTFSSVRMKELYQIEECVTEKVNAWAEPYGWKTEVVIASGVRGEYKATVLVGGEPPFPTGDDLAVEELPCGVTSMQVDFVPLWSYDTS